MNPVKAASQSLWVGLGGLAGLAFVTLTVAGGVVQGEVPVYSDGAGAVKAWFAANHGRYLVGSCLIALGLPFYLFFLATLTRVLVSVQGLSNPWTWLAVFGGIHLLVAAQASIAFDGTLALLKGEVADDVARALSAGDYMTLISLYLFAGVLTLSTSALNLQHRLLWRPLTWLGLLIALGGLASVTAPLQHDAEGTLTMVGYLTLLAFLVWVAGLSISFLWPSPELREMPSLSQPAGSTQVKGQPQGALP